MDKKRQKTTEDRKKMRKLKEAEPEASSKSVTSDVKQQQQTSLRELTDTKSDQSDGNLRMKIGVGAKRTKKPPKSLENFICRPTIRISQRLAHGDGHSSCGGEVSSPDIRVAKQSHREIQKKDRNDCISPKASTRLSVPLPTSSKKADSKPVITASKKAPSKHMRKTDSKSLLTSDGPSYAVQPQTDSKVPLSDKITSSTLLKQTYSPPAVPSPPSSLQQNSSPQDSTQVLNAQKEKGENLPTGEAMTSSLSSHGSNDMMLNAQTSQQSSSSIENDRESTSFPISCSENLGKQTPCPPKKSRIKESNVDKVLNATEKEYRDSACSKNMSSTITISRSKENGLLHQQSPSIKTPLLLTASDKSAESATPENSTCMPELLESRGRNKYNESEVIDDSRKMTMEPTQAVAVQPKDGSRVGQITDKNKKRARHSSNQDEDVQCSSQPSGCADSQFNSSVPSDEPPLHPKQNIISQKKQKAVQMTKMENPGEKVDLVKTANVSSTACKKIPQKSNLKKIPSIKSSKALSLQSRQAGQPPTSKQLQNVSPRSETFSFEPPPKKRGRPKITKLEKTPQESKSQKSSTKFPILEDANVPDPENGLKLPKPTRKTLGHPKCSSTVQKKRSKSLDSASGKKGAAGKLKPSLSKARDAQINRKRNRLIMKTIITNINKMRVKKKDKVLTQFLSGQSQSYKSDFAQKDNEGDADCSVSDGTHTLSSLVTSFGGKFGSQINISKRGTIYIGKRRGRKPKTQRETSGQDSEQVMGQKSQQVLAESSNQLNSWSTSDEHSHSFDGQSALGSSPYSFKHLVSPSPTSSPSLQRKLHLGNREYDQRSAPKVTSSQRVKAVQEEKSKLPSSSQSSPSPSATSQLGSVRIQDRRTTHLGRSVLMEKERLKYKCQKKAHNCFSHDKFRRHQHKCKKKYLQLRAKRQDPAFLAEIEELVVRLSEIRIVHHISSRGCGDEAKSGRKSGKGKAHPHVLQCLPQNLHHPAMFQINFSGYYSPQSDFSRDSLHYVGMADFKRNNGCPSQPGEHIVTHCPVVHKLGFPLSGGGCYHSPYKMPLSTTSFGFGLYRGYPPSATIYPSSPFLPSYVHPYSKNPILSPSKFHKRKHKFLRRDSLLCGGMPQGTYANVTSHSPDWFNRNSWQREDNGEQARDKRFVDDRLRERDGIEGLLGQSKLRKDHFRRGPPSNPPCSSSTPSKQADKHKTSPLSYIGLAHLRPISKVRWAEHQQPWRWRESTQVEPGNRVLNQEAESGYQEDDDEGDEDLPSPPLADRAIHHHSFLRNPNLASSAYSRMTAQMSVGEVRSASRNLMRPGGSLMKDCSAGGIRTSESFQPGGSLFSEHYPHASPSLNEGQERGGKEKRPNISRTHFQTNDIRPFSSCTATKVSLSHLNKTKNAIPNKSKLKHVKKPLKKKNPKGQEVTGSEVKRRGRGRPRKNPAPCFSPPLPATPLHHETTECPAKCKKGDDYTVLNATESMAQHEKRKRKKKRDETKSNDGQVDEGKDSALSQEPSQSHIDTSSPSQDLAVSVNSQSEKRSDVATEKKYEWAGLYSDAYKSENPHNPTSLSSPVHTDCLDYDPEEHEHVLLPAPIHVGKYLRLKRIDFQLPYDIYRLCAQEKRPKKSRKTPRKTAPSNGSVDVMSRTQTEDSSCKHQKLSVTRDCISESLNRNVSARPNTEEVEKEMSETDIDNNLPNQPDPPKQQEKGNDAENIPSPLLMMPLPCEERSFVLEHGIFLVRNYEKMRDRQALLLREEVTEREEGNEEDRGSSQKGDQKGDLEDTSTKSDQRLTHSSPQSENREGDEEGRSVQSRNLTQTLQGIYDVIVSHKGSSGQTLASPLLNLCSRKRSDSAPVDFNTLHRQLLSGHYESLDTFHSDMLKVFHCAEVKTALLEMPFVSMDTADA
ncbi:histone-lysine N-methyltransferase ASH1L-like isoform X2 [Sinocyclocheilus anshuiensis]|uniref:Histone-lysine N-methyltransferase ASH1L-like n=1 Tax=Sinocyclocheilus anshuiensis TaxID=1608454 RepID=A0A671PWD1_9TELE|nr:PREDICTED: histone-lysine N-methyltransferase ASH1L-like isoform X2 [Sinocyclocheilus anshuiensis]